MRHRLRAVFINQSNRDRDGFFRAPSNLVQVWACLLGVCVLYGCIELSVQPKCWSLTRVCVHTSTITISERHGNSNGDAYIKIYLNHKSQCTKSWRIHLWCIWWEGARARHIVSALAPNEVKHSITLGRLTVCQMIFVRHTLVCSRCSVTER